jgi:hypothetical protein
MNDAAKITTAAIVTPMARFLSIGDMLGLSD